MLPPPRQPGLGAAASALILVVAQTTDETGRPRPWALHDSGQAVSALTVQAREHGPRTRESLGALLLHDPCQGRPAA